MQLPGIGISPGIAEGKVFVYDPHTDLKVFRRTLKDTEIEGEIKRFEEALKKTARQIQRIKTQVQRTLGEKESHIFAAHEMILSDPEFISEVKERVLREKTNVEHILQDVVARYEKMFRKIDDDYLRERAVDIRDIGNRILGNVLNRDFTEYLQRCGGLDRLDELRRQELFPAE